MEYVIRNKQTLTWTDKDHPCPNPHWEKIYVVGKDWQGENKTAWMVMCVGGKVGKGCGKCKKEVEESFIKQFYGPLP